MRLDLLDLVTSATREDILWLLKGARAPSYKIVAPSSTSKPAQGQGQGCHRWRSLAFRQKPVQSTCNPANSAKSAPTSRHIGSMRKGAPAVSPGETAGAQVRKRGAGGLVGADFAELAGLHVLCTGFAACCNTPPAIAALLMTS